MEEVAWIAIGIVSFLIVIGVLVNFSSIQSAEERKRSLSNSLDSMALMCDSICHSPDGNYRSVDAEIPRGTLLETNEAQVCGAVGGSFECRNCPCEFEGKTVLNLTSDQVSNYFNMHTYKCYFLKQNGNLSLDCRG